MRNRESDLTSAVVDAAVLGFALWTLCCHATVLAGGNGYLLMTLAAVAFPVAAAVAAFVLVRRRNAPRSDSVAPASETGAQRGSHWRVAAVGTASTLAVAAVALTTRDRWLLWGGALAMAAAASVWALAQPPAPVRPAGAERPTPLEQGLLWVIACIGAFSTLSMRLFNTDDTVYVNIAVALADAPERTLFVHDTIHDAGVDLLPAYRIHSYELLAGVLSWLSGIPALEVVHLGLAGFAGLLTPLAWARLFRILDPHRWLWMVAIVTSWYLFDGSAERSLPMHAFARLFQGKAILATVAVPLVAAHAIAFARAPSVRGFLLLTAAQICGLGLSSTGLWLAPLVAAVGVCVPLQLRWSSLRPLALGALSCAYPLAVALWMKSVLRDWKPSRAPGQPRAPEPVEQGPSVVEAAMQAIASAGEWLDGIGHILVISLGDVRIVAAYGLVLMLALWMARTPLARRYLAAFTLFGIGVLLNPLLVKLLKTNVTGDSTYARVLWFLPLPAAMAVLFSSAVPAGASARRRLAWGALGAAALAAFYALVPLQSVLAATYASPGANLKVQTKAYTVARMLTRLLPDRGRVLLPPDVSLHVPLLHRHPYPIMTKPILFKADRGDAFQRLSLRRVVQGRGGPIVSKRRRWFERSLDRYQVTGVVVAPPAARIRGLASTLQRKGFTRVAKHEGYRIWVRSLPSAPEPRKGVSSSVRRLRDLRLPAPDLAQPAR